MKKLACVFVAMAAAILLSGCATSYPVGAAYTNLKLPVTVGPEAGNEKYTKIGIAESHSILSLVATGDSSIAAACANDNITKIHHVDWEVENYFGVYATYKTVVYGN